MVFPSNQVKQFFVLTNKKNDNARAEVLKGSAGTYCINKDTVDNTVSLTIKGAKNGITTTDIIDKKCLIKATYHEASSLTTPLKGIKVALNSDVNEGNPVISQDYVLAIDFKQGAGYSDEDTYIKHAAVRATSATDTPAKFYSKLAVSLFQNFKKVYSPLIKIANVAAISVTEDEVVVGLAKSDDFTSVTPDGKYTVPVNKNGSIVTFTDGIYLLAESQEDQWVRGHKELQFVNFDVHFSTIKVDGMDEVWGEKSDVTKLYGKSVSNGYTTADMEWYFMGDRADMYRDVCGAGKSIDTQYMVDPTKSYDFVEIQYYYSGPGTEDTGKSPKHLTLVAEAGTANLSTIVTALNA